MRRRAATGARTALAGQAGEEAAAAELKRDARRAQVVEPLTRALIPYRDSQGLFMYSRPVDELLDNLRDFVPEVDLYRVRPALGWVSVLEEIRVGVRALRAATECLRRDVGRASVVALAAKKAPVRTQYQQAMARLLAEPLTSEVLRRLDTVGLRLSEAADHLATAAIKRGT